MERDQRPDTSKGRPVTYPPQSGEPVEPSDEPIQAEGRRRGNRHHAFRRKNRSRQADRASSPSDGESAPTSAQMRGARASGRSPGLRTAQEPAAAPLGTDDEAAGTPDSGAALQQEIDRAEQARGMQGLTAEEAMSGRPGHPEESPRAFGKLVTIGAAIVILVVLAMLLF